MPLPSGSRLGSYEILSSLGAGGMGEVYRARDTKLHRDVAIKVLPDLFANDPERRSRFQREAHVLASLNNPHIAHVYGVVDEPAALVMELVDGEDLALRLARGAIPLREALVIAEQIADALQAAHDTGVVHRDLKPANVKLREDGTVKVLDFGLAKLMNLAEGVSSPAASGSPAAARAAAMNSPTFTSPAMTQLGVILGTAAYMSPEQAKGKAVDRGTDLWAFGAVLYEMLAGRPAFDGETVTDVLAAIVTRDPDWSLLPPDAPAVIRRLLARCLERDRRRRLSDAGEARHQIEEALTGASVPAALMPQPRRSRAAIMARLTPWLIAAGVVVVALALPRRSTVPVEFPARYSLEIPPKTSLLLTGRPAVAVSPDRSAVVFAAASEGVERLYLRRIDSFDAVPLSGTEGGSHPVISPDGRWLAFVSGTKLAKMPLGGGPVTTLGDVSDSRGLSWDSNETITYTPTTTGGIFQVPAGGGTPVQVTTPKSGVERTHRWPQQLPDGTLIYTVGGFSSPDSYENATIDAFSPRTGGRRTLVTGAMARYIHTGHLVFLRGASLFAVGFDPATLEVKGAPALVLQGVATDPTTGAAHFDATRSGSLVYVSAGKESALLRPMEVDRTGRVEPLSLPLGTYSDPAISPDGQQLAYALVSSTGGRDIWVYNRVRKSPSRMTFEGQNVTPVWTRDGSMLYYTARDPGARGSKIMRRRSDGSREAEEVVQLQELSYLDYVDRDEKTAVIEVLTGGPHASDIYQVTLRSGAKPTPILATGLNEYGAALSPDGRWIAFLTTESGRTEVYVRPATGAGGRWQVSTNGGEEPKWSPDGRQLYYRNGNVLMAVTVGGGKGESFEASVPTQIMSGVYNLRSETGLSYDVDPKTGGFIMLRQGDEAVAANALRIVTDWARELRAATAK